jgi:hypothetical protein
MTTPASGHTVPPAVARQAAEADRLLAEINARPGSQPAQPPASAPPVAQQPPSQAPAQQPPRAAAPPPSPTAVAASVETPVSMEEQLRRAEARFATLQGKYNAETSLMRQQLEQNTQIVTQLLEERRQPPTATAAPTVPVTPEDQVRALGATDKDIEEYGDLLPLVAKMANNMVRPTLEKLNAELSRLQQGQTQTAAGVRQSRVQALEAQLDSTVPAWRQINEAQEFLDWLDIVDIFSGVTRRVALTDAYNKLDAARVVAIFQAYAREYPAQARAPGAPIVDAGTLVAPEVRGGTVAAPEGMGGKRTWSESEIADFYVRVRKKQVSPEQYQAMMAEIAAASREGRIAPTRKMRHANEAF